MKARVEKIANQNAVLAIMPDEKQSISFPLILLPARVKKNDILIILIKDFNEDMADTEKMKEMLISKIKEKKI